MNIVEFIIKHVDKIKAIEEFDNNNPGIYPWKNERSE